MTANAIDISPGAALSELEQALLRERIDYLYKNTDFAATLFRHLTGYAIVAADFDGNVVAFNEGARRAFGYTPEEVIGRQRIDLFFPRDFIEAGKLQQAVAAVIGNEQFSYEGEMLRRGDQPFPAHAVLTLTKDMTGHMVGVVLMAEDITERKQAQERIEKLNTELEQRVVERTAKLAESEEKLRTTMETARDAIVVVEGEHGTITSWNPAAEAIFGYSRGEIVGRPVHEILPPPRFRGAALRGMTHFAQTGEGAAIGKTLELTALHKNGTEFPIALSLSAMQIQGKWHASGIARDISERKNREAQIVNLNIALRILSTGNSVLIHAQTEEELCQNVCRNIVEIGSYRLAWVEYPGEEADTLRFAAYFGDEALHQMALRPEHVSRCLTAAALRTRQTQAWNNLHEMLECSIAQLREVGIEAILALPLISDNQFYGALTIFSSVAKSFGADDVKLMEELAADLAYGVTTLRTRAERDQGVKRERVQAVELRQALERTISAIALTVEKRDPYTAGHQQRVAEIATAIAKEMGLPQQQIDGIRLGALIHDLGKVYVPAEILSRPGKLSKLEFDIIKTHVQVGYDIVKDIPFPWPVALMVYEHHERLDGSGYPRGLKGEEIILEARILAVADVIEAVSSHRPYRPSRGIDAALEEIATNSGGLYDPQAAGACLHLFRDKGYVLPA